ncbi:MAG: hypothetical protein AAGE65_03615 [Planctomycetota bacterium]
MIRSPAERERLAAELTAASKEIDGVRYLRASVAARILGVGPGHQSAYIRDGRIMPVRVRVPRSPQAPRGLLTALPLGQTIALLDRPIKRDWTASEDAQLADRMAAGTPTKTIARLHGRTVKAVRRRALHLRLHRRHETALLTTGNVAQLCGVSRQAVRWWTEHGLAYTPMRDGQRERMIDPKYLIAYLSDKPTWSKLSARRRERLEAMAMTPTQLNRLIDRRAA